MRRPASVVLALSILVIGACGGGAPPREATEAEPTPTSASPTSETEGQHELTQGEPVELVVGLIPIIDVAPLYIAIEQGWFEDEGLVVKPEIAQTGAATAAAVISGEQQIGFAAIAPVLQARQRGLPLQLIAPSISSIPPDPPAPNGNNPVVVLGDSRIETPEDLNGKTIAVNALQAVAELLVRASADTHGADSSTFQFVAVPFPEMITALESRRVDAVALVPPFYEAALQRGHRAVFYSYPYEDEDVFPLAAWFASESFIESNRETVAAFARVIRRANAFARENPDQVRAIVPTYTQIPPEVAEGIFLPVFDTELNVSGIEREAALMVRYGFLDGLPEIARAIAEL